MNLKAFLTNHHENTVLKSCIFGEKIAIFIYKKVLQKHIENISSKQNSMITRQLANVKKDNSQVKNRIRE
ncbi:hypothetical protein HNP25_003061 [Arcicella rosea]|uniref:Uncharacterized protein n=1 Tax=Arcicella rosea TaxID=502909 RepID=A0A841EUS8_9BACT|nr:hypothetical protein [Arcicella rosea]